MKYRKRPVVVEAIQWTGDNYADEIQPFLDDADYYLSRSVRRLMIRTLESGQQYHEAPIGWWIIKGVQGEFYPCKPDIFEATYEPVDERDPVGNIGLSGHLRIMELFPPRAK